MNQLFDSIHYKNTTREQWQTAAEAWHRWRPTLKTWLGPATNLMLDMAKEKKATTWKEIESELSLFEKETGFSGPCEMVIGVGQKPLSRDQEFAFEPNMIHQKVTFLSLPHLLTASHTTVWNTVNAQAEPGGYHHGYY